MPAELTGLTGRQELVWIEQQLAPDVPMNNLAMTFAIEGPLDPARLAAAFHSVARESDALRTVIDEVDGAPAQRVLPAPPVEMELVDLSARSETFEPWLDERATRRFDLARAAYDTAIVKLAPERWCWFVCQHHVVTDARSFELLYERVAERYRNPDAPAPDADAFEAYRATERAHRGSEAAALSAAFWRETLGEADAPPHFYGHPPTGTDPATLRESVALEPALGAELASLAGGVLGSTVSTDLAMTACFAALLAAFTHRVTLRRRIGIGFPVHNRRTRRLRGTIGLLMEMQVLRVEVDPKQGFGALLERTFAALLEALRHARYCNPDGPKYADVSLNYNLARFPDFAGWPTRAESWSGCARLRAGGDPRARRASRRPRLGLQVQDFAGQGVPRLDFELSADVFAGARASVVPRHFERLLRAVAMDPKTRIEELAIFDDVERAELERRFEADRRTPDPAPSVAPCFEAPRTPLEETIARAWADTLRTEAVGIHDDFFDLGGTSFAALALFRRLRAACGVELPLAMLFRAPTVARMAAAIEEQRRDGPQAFSTVVEIRAGGDLPPLFCAAGTGGNVLNLRRLALHLGERQPFYGLQTRGVVGHAEIPHGRVEEIARESLADLRRLRPSGPYYLAGYSAGGAVAYEMARMLSREGESVGALLLLDAYAPSIRTRGRIERARLHLARLRAAGPRYLVRKLGDRVVGDAKRLRERFYRLRARLFPARYTEVRFAVVRREVQRLYAPPPAPLAGVLFRVDRSPHDLDTRVALDETNGWDRYLLGGVRVVPVPGGHMDMCEEPHVAVLAERVREALAAARADAEGIARGAAA